MPTVTRELVVSNRLGLHLRAASSVVHLASRFQCRIFLHANGTRANAKSIMNIAMLAAAEGTPVLVEAEGPDAREAVDALERLFLSRFGDES